MGFQKRILQLKTPKTASSSIEDGLSRLRKNKIIQTTKSFGHGTPDKIVNFLGSKNYNGAFVVVSVRNPYGRLLSAFKYLIENKKDKPEHQHLFKLGSFENFCLELPNMDMKDFLTGKCRFYHKQKNWTMLDNKKSYDFIIRYESLLKDWNTLVSIISDKQINLGRIRQSEHDHWKNVYTDKMREIVYNIYKDDFDLLGYIR